MKILLIEPVYFIQRWPFEIYGTRRHFYSSPLGLLQLASYFPEETRVIDGMNELKMTPKKLAKILKNYNNSNDIIGIGSHSNIGSINTIYTLKLAKSFAPKATLLMGGYHATFFHKLWIKIGADLVIRNEAEITYSHILNKLQDTFLRSSKIELEDLIGTTFSLEWFNEKNNKKENNFFTKNYNIDNFKDWKKIFNYSLLIKGRKIKIMKDRPFCKDLNSFPIPSREKTDYRKNYLPFSKQKGYVTTMETARGCPYSCKFCSTRIMWRSKQRYKSVDNIIIEIKDCLKRGIWTIYFIDESWGINYIRDFEFLERIEKEKLNFNWGAQIRTDTIANHPDLIKKAGGLGLRMALVGYETLDQKILDNCNKGTSLSQFVKASKILKEAQIFNFAYFMIGLPGEKEKNRKKMLSNMKSLCDMALIQNYIPYFPNAFEDYKKNEFLFGNHRLPFFNVDTNKIKVLNMNKNEKNQLKRLTKLIRFYIINLYLNPRNIIALMKREGDFITQTKKNFLKLMYKSFITNLFRFRPQNFLNFIRGFQK